MLKEYFQKLRLSKFSNALLFEVFKFTKYDSEFLNKILKNKTNETLTCGINHFRISFSIVLRFDNKIRTFIGLM
ncbi:MAG TPA: hypothetical protein DCM02_09710 [Flavobacterium sp.]|nr:hypothetical protein [Flavobacterium sp.]